MFELLPRTTDPNGATAVLDAPARTNTEVINAILNSLGITPITPSSAQVYMERVLREGWSTDEPGFRSGTERDWVEMSLSGIAHDQPPAPGIPPVPDALMTPLRTIADRAQQEGVDVHMIALIKNDDPLVGIRYEDNGERVTVLTGGYALDARHARVLVGGLRA